MVMGQTGSRQAEWSKAAQHKYLSARQSFPRTKEFVQLHPEGLMTDYLQNFLYTHWRLTYALLRSIHSTQKCTPKKLKLFLCLIHLYKITNLEPKAHNVHQRTETTIWRSQVSTRSGNSDHWLMLFDGGQTCKFTPQFVFVHSQVVYFLSVGILNLVMLNLKYVFIFDCLAP